MGIIYFILLQKIVDECEKIFSYYILTDSSSNKSYKYLKINEQFMKIIANLLANLCRLPMLYKPKDWGKGVEGGYLNDIYRACYGRDLIHNNTGNM